MEFVPCGNSAEVEAELLVKATAGPMDTGVLLLEVV
jgi:hypothetical protein